MAGRSRGRTRPAAREGHPGGDGGAQGEPAEKAGPPALPGQGEIAEEILIIDAIFLSGNS